MELIGTPTCDKLVAIQSDIGEGPTLLPSTYHKQYSQLLILSYIGLI